MARNVEILKQIYGALGRGELGSVLSSFDQRVVNVAAIAEELLGAAPERFETFALQLEQFIDGSDMVVVTGRFLPAAQRREATREFVHVWDLRDGRVSRFRTYKDTATAMRALGRTSED